MNAAQSAPSATTHRALDVPPGTPIVTILGDGQLARMMQTEAIELGIGVRLLTASRDASAAQVVANPIIGDYRQVDDVLAAAAGSDVVTFDHEHVPVAVMDALIAAGHTIHPSPQALQYAQDKTLMRRKLAELDLPVPAFTIIDDPTQVAPFFNQVAGRLCIKTARGGYDGHGVWFPATVDDATDLVRKLLADGNQVLAEERLTLTRELSVLIARRPSGEMVTWPVIESVQRDGICHSAIAPAPHLAPQLAERAVEIAETIATQLGVTGVMAVELFAFLDHNGAETVSVNELAMRPHNTGHFTQFGSVTSQFEQHLRACLDLPLGSTAKTHETTCMVNVLGADTAPHCSVKDACAAVWQRYPAAKIHLYGKQWRPGRKLGHVIMASDSADPQQLLADATAAAHCIRTGEWNTTTSATG
ncbi:5-(carboxyamino)imidazole ribonucleotide synthase [Corynebacterium choanae]|uniref:5-(carboxyamino)imidazole ribonucleotide synthase n=1 Tax=Corynebacterium choanae TaxID=1862358 RepID=UPI001FE714E6|nr:5-(carboxyamino)imidazole ribonucleotide synthase [Corynebacterium choanae]